MHCDGTRLGLESGVWTGAEIQSHDQNFILPTRSSAAKSTPEPKAQKRTALTNGLWGWVDWEVSIICDNSGETMDREFQMPVGGKLAVAPLSLSPTELCA